MIETSQLFHELTMLYLKNQDLSGKTPAEYLSLYMSVIDEIMDQSAEGLE